MFLPPGHENGLPRFGRTIVFAGPAPDAKFWNEFGNEKAVLIRDHADRVRGTLLSARRTIRAIVINDTVRPDEIDDPELKKALGGRGERSECARRTDSRAGNAVIFAIPFMEIHARLEKACQAVREVRRSDDLRRTHSRAELA